MTITESTPTPGSSKKQTREEVQDFLLKRETIVLRPPPLESSLPPLSRNLFLFSSHGDDDDECNQDMIEKKEKNGDFSFSSSKPSNNFLSKTLKGVISVSLLCQRFNRKQKRFAVIGTQSRKQHSMMAIRSALDDRKLTLGSGDGGAKPVRVLLEKLFAQTQQLEEQISRGSSTSDGIQLGFNLESMESDLVAALAALRKKEEELKNAEGVVVLEHAELNRAKQELEMQEKDIAAARSKQQKIEKDLKQANHNLASQARKIEDLKLLVKERDRQTVAAQSALSFKVGELDKMRNQLRKKTEEAEMKDSELQSKIQLLNEATEVIKKQKIEVQELQKELILKKQELEESVKLRKIGKEKLKHAEANLEKRTVEWLSAQKEMKMLAEVAQKHMGETDKSLQDFKRVKKLLAAVRSELVSSQKSLASSRRKMKEQENQLENQLAELEEQKRIMTTHMMSLKDAQVEVESMRPKIRIAEARNKELERDLCLNKELIEQLQEDLNVERTCVEQAGQEITLLRDELEHKSSEFERSQNLLQIKESELVEARLQIQHLKSEWTSNQLILQEKDAVLFNAQQTLEKLTQDVVELKGLLSSKEEQLIQVTMKLQERDEQVHSMQYELNDTKLKFSEASDVVERIRELTNKLVSSVKDEVDVASGSLEEEVQLPENDRELLQKVVKNPMESFRWQRKQLATELEMTRESLRERELEVLAAQRAIVMKDQELKTILSKLDEREVELMRTKEEMLEDASGLKKLYSLAQERMGGKSIGDLAIEKLQLEAAQLEVEAATAALDKLATMSGELLEKATLCADFDLDNIIIPQLDVVNPITDLTAKEEHFSEAQKEVARLSALTDQLVKQAGVVSTA